MMKCEDYKEAIAADPWQAFDGDARHAAACVSCADFTASMQALDQRIARALAIDVPQLDMPVLAPLDDGDLAAVTVLPLRGRGQLSTPAWLGLAAGVVLALVVAGGFLPGYDSDLSLADEIIAHLDHEPNALRVTTQAVSNRELHGVINGDVAALDDGIGLVTYARSCVINGHTIPHLVIQGEKGPVTLLLLPNEPVDMAIPLYGKGVHGVLLPVGRGSIAIIGDREEPIEEIEQRVIDSVTWRI